MDRFWVCDFLRFELYGTRECDHDNEIVAVAEHSFAKVPGSTKPAETAPNPTEPEPAQRRDAGSAILGIQVVLIAAVFAVKRLYRKRA